MSGSLFLQGSKLVQCVQRYAKNTKIAETAKSCIFAILLLAFQELATKPTKMNYFY